VVGLLEYRWLPVLLGRYARGASGIVFHVNRRLDS
jgi:hypothetical protein